MVLNVYVYHEYNTYYVQAVIVVFWKGYLDEDIMLKLHVIMSFLLLAFCCI